MSIPIVIDMNLSPKWVDALLARDWPSAHWSSIGDPGAADETIMIWARANGYMVFTHDLDFGTMLALTHAAGPSVIQVRGQNVRPGNMLQVVVSALRQYESELKSGALLVVEENRRRIRILPI